MTTTAYSEIDVAHACARAAARKWQRSRCGIDRLLAEQLGTEAARLELEALEALKGGGL